MCQTNQHNLLTQTVSEKIQRLVSMPIRIQSRFVLAKERFVDSVTTRVLKRTMNQDT